MGLLGHRRKRKFGWGGQGQYPMLPLMGMLFNFNTECFCLLFCSEDPKVSGGLKDMQILKTTQSGFTG